MTKKEELPRKHYPSPSMEGFIMSEQQQQTDASSSSHHSPSMEDGGVCFFADATLDLEQAHAIAETPEPKKQMVVVSTGSTTTTTASALLHVPSLQEESKLKQETPQDDLSSNNKKQATTRSDNSAAPPFLQLNRLTHEDHERHTSIPTHQPTYRPKPPRRPRDIAWAMAFLLLVPLSLTPSLYPNNNNTTTRDWFVVSRHFTLVGIVVAFGVAHVLNRFLYRTMSGGDGDDARHVMTQVLLVLACPISVLMNPLLWLAMLWQTPRALKTYGMIPLVFFLRDAWTLRHWRQNGGASSASSSSSSRDAGWLDQGRQTFFQALAKMTLDILSRSLRRSSFYRATVVLLTLQFAIIWLWRLVVLKALATMSSDSTSSTPKALFLVTLALVGGKWATGTVTRILGLLASGGITSWFAEQSMRMEEMEQMQQQQQQENEQHNDDNAATANNQDSVASRARARAALYSMPEAYRTADASAYMSVLDMDDEGMDDDFDDEEEEIETVRGGGATTATGGMGGSNVKAFVFSALTVSFGSVAQCGLLGGLAQFVWSVLRQLDTIMASFSSSSSGRFQGMQIGTITSSRLDGNVSVVWKITTRIHGSARSFVRNHTDLGMTHVAAYFKHYQRAAKDVFMLVETSGVEPILYNDITSRMCACVCGSIASIVVLLLGSLLSHNNHHHLSDQAIVECMLLTFLWVYTLVGTVMEPLRASIMAVYICFAQHPTSLSQSFPLIFHRLSRISEARMV